MKTKILSVPGISCAHCEKSINGALVNQNGISNVKITLSRKTVEVTFDEAKISVDKIKELIEEEGYDIGNVE